MNRSIHDKLLCSHFSFAACINAGSNVNVTNAVLPAFDALGIITPTGIQSRDIVPAAG